MTAYKVKELIKEGALSTQSVKEKLKFRGRCYNCDKTRHMVKDCKALKRNLKEGKSPSTRPLLTPSRGRGLSPSLTSFMEGAKSAIKQS
jgi:hypothetical protein